LVEKVVAPEKSEKPGKPEKAEKPQKADKKASAKAPEALKKKDHPDNFKFIVRMVNTDINGELSVLIGLTRIKGIGLRAAQTIAKMAGIEFGSQMGMLDDAAVAKLEETINSYVELVPSWMVNRQHDWESGDDMHLVGIDVEIVLKDDINRMKMIRCYKGIRHERGQKVRGQRTRSNGRTGLQMGVIKKKLAPGEAPAAKTTEKVEKAPKAPAKAAEKGA
jgi:small subunit ribosomal protein S13